MERNLNGGTTASNPARKAAEWRRRVATARRELAAIEALPVTEAARLITEYAAQQQSQRQAIQQRRHGRARVQRPAIQAATDRGIGR